MSLFQRNLSIYVAFLMIIYIIGVSSRRSSHNRHILEIPAESNIPTVVVDKSGHGNFLTIQSAIDSVPSNNNNWICIYIKAGTYNEQVKIPADKPMIYLKGEGQYTTNVVMGLLVINTGATFRTQANNIVVKGLSFTNSYNYPPDQNRNPVQPATAALIEGDKNSFYDCGFYGFQDTLWDYNGRHYFHGCDIAGAIDFIMGSGQSFYENCNIHVITKSLGGTPEYITAQWRENPNDGNGFVFKYSNVDGDGWSYLGRPWQEYARVLYYKSNFNNIIVPQGWDVWDNYTHVDRPTFAEHGCGGQGADTSKRVTWEKKLSEHELQILTDISFIDREGWIKQQPYNILPATSYP